MKGDIGTIVLPFVYNEFKLEIGLIRGATESCLSYNTSPMLMSFFSSSITFFGSSMTGTIVIAGGFSSYIGTVFEMGNDDYIPRSIFSKFRALLILGFWEKGIVVSAIFMALRKPSLIGGTLTRSGYFVSSTTLMTSICFSEGVLSGSAKWGLTPFWTSSSVKSKLSSELDIYEVLDFEEENSSNITTASLTSSI